MSHLSASGSFLYFTIGLVLGSILVFVHLGKPITPSIPVVVYGILLLNEQTKFPLSSSVKDSPYFLGFLLSLVALFAIIRRGFGEQLSREFLIEEVGSAVFTTAAGVFMRQFILSRDPREEDQERVFETIAAEIRREAVTFHDAQASFVTLVNELAKSRKELWAREEEAFSAYIESLREGASILGRIQKQYPKKIESLLSAVEDQSSKVDAAFGAVISQFENGSGSLGVLVGSLAQKATEQASKIGDAFGTIVAEAEKGGALIGAQHEHLQQSFSGFGELVEKSIAGMSILAANVAELSSGYNAGAGVIKASAADLATQVDILRGKLSGFGSELDRMNGEIRQIDNLIDDFVELLERRLERPSARS